jgi:hypothetical protein
MKASQFQQSAMQDFKDEIVASQNRKKPKNKNIAHMVIKQRTFDALEDVLIQILKNQKRMLETMQDKTNKEKLQKSFEEVK